MAYDCTRPPPQSRCRWCNLGHPHSLYPRSRHGTLCRSRSAMRPHKRSSLARTRPPACTGSRNRRSSCDFPKWVFRTLGPACNPPFRGGRSARRRRTSAPGRPGSRTRRSGEGLSSGWRTSRCNPSARQDNPRRTACRRRHLRRCITRRSRRTFGGTRPMTHTLPRVCSPKSRRCTGTSRLSTLDEGRSSCRRRRNVACSSGSPRSHRPSLDCNRRCRERKRRHPRNKFARGHSSARIPRSSSGLRPWRPHTR